MPSHPRRPALRPRRAVAAVERALLLPILVFVLVIGVDFAQVFYHCVTLTNRARTGGLYGSTDPAHAADRRTSAATSSSGATAASTSTGAPTTSPASGASSWLSEAGVLEQIAEGPQFGVWEPR